MSKTHLVASPNHIRQLTLEPSLCRQNHSISQMRLDSPIGCFDNDMSHNFRLVEFPDLNLALNTLVVMQTPLLGLWPWPKISRRRPCLVCAKDDGRRQGIFSKCIYILRALRHSRVYFLSALRLPRYSACKRSRMRLDRFLTLMSTFLLSSLPCLSFASPVDSAGLAPSSLATNQTDALAELGNLNGMSPILV